MKSRQDIEKAIIAFAGNGMLDGNTACAFAGVKGHSTKQKFLAQIDSYDPNGSGRKRYFARDIARYLYSTQMDVGEFNVTI